VYLGSHSISMDAKGRMAIPARIRETLVDACAGKIVITANPETQGGERCLWIYPEPEWLEILPKIQALPTFNKKAQRTQRLLMGHATPLEMDGNGRVLVPPTLREYAALDKKLMLIGQGNKLELWSEARWTSWLDEAEDDDEMPPEMLTLSL